MKITLILAFLCAASYGHCQTHLLFANFSGRQDTTITEEVTNISGWPPYQLYHSVDLPGQVNPGAITFIYELSGKQIPITYTLIEDDYYFEGSGTSIVIPVSDEEKLLLEKRAKPTFRVSAENDILITGECRTRYIWDYAAGSKDYYRFKKGIAFLNKKRKAGI
jgi:hypothetical protein